MSTFPRKWPRVRFSVRGLLIAVMIVAAIILVGVAVEAFRPTAPRQLRLTAEEYCAQAEKHADLERKYADLTVYADFRHAHGTSIQGGKFIHLKAGQIPELVPKYRALTEYHRVLKEKYDRAAANPRKPVEPDPPEPPVPE
jgi:hypothetical protein